MSSSLRKVYQPEIPFLRAISASAFLVQACNLLSFMPANSTRTCRPQAHGKEGPGETSSLSFFWLPKVPFWENWNRSGVQAKPNKHAAFTTLDGKHENEWTTHGLQGIFPVGEIASTIRRTLAKPRWVCGTVATPAVKNSGKGRVIQFSWGILARLRGG